MSEEFKNKHIVVTGGTGALGTAVVQALVDRGAVCHVTCYSASELDTYALNNHPNVHITPGMDLTKEELVVEFFESLPSLWGSAHIAGGFAMAPLTETSLSDFQRMLAMNATTCFLSCREAVRAMRKSEGQGRIVNVAARPALVPTAGMVSYAASKAAVASMTQSLGEELASESIFVNAVVPSVMDTPANRGAMPDADHSHWPSVNDVAQTMVFLLSPTNTSTRGGLIPVYGKA
jgi:NAD(P)-dependent dehydrogenase (short-subunit alcohol dehydrogenase family)